MKQKERTKRQICFFKTLKQHVRVCLTLVFHLLGASSRIYSLVPEKEIVDQGDASQHFFNQHSDDSSVLILCLHFRQRPSSWGNESDRGESGSLTLETALDFALDGDDTRLQLLIPADWLDAG